MVHAFVILNFDYFTALKSKLRNIKGLLYQVAKI